MFLMRFDLRAPGADASGRAARYRSAIEMSAWADARGCGGIVLSEHHNTDDGYLASPMTLAAAVAAVTTTTPIVVAATLLPLADPVRLAEEIITLDHISEGRVLVVLGLGYRPSEYALHGLDFAERAALADSKLGRLVELIDDAAAATSSPRVTPAPFSSPRPLIAWGGGSIAAARRAGRFGVGFYAQTNSVELKEAYREAATAAGHRPGLCVLPPPDLPLIVFVNDDPDQGWEEVGGAMVLDARSYHDWNEAAGHTRRSASLPTGRDLTALRGANGAHRVVTAAGARELIDTYGLIGLHPLCGGLEVDVAWRYLRRAVEAVSPTASEETPAT